jgi:DNA-binding transcriptional LysR family regulator
MFSPMPRRPNLVAMQAFRRVVELRSFNAAANRLDLTGGAVSKLVTQLERDLGVRLLQRTTRRVSVTEAGTAFYEAAVRILDDVDASTEALRAGAAAPTGRLRVSVPTSFALMWLSSRLPGFIAAWPLLELDLVLNDRFVDIVQEGFDCAIRITADMPDSSLVARTLGSVDRVLVGSPAYIAHAPTLLAPADLVSHACLLYSETASPDEWPVPAGAGMKRIRVHGICRVNNSVMLRDMLIAGLGLALTPTYVVQDLLDAGVLVRLLPDHPLPPLRLHAVIAHQRYVPLKVRVFLDFVEQEMAAWGAPRTIRS